MPSWELFRTQPRDYRRAVLGDAPRVAVEAAARFGWDEGLGEGGAVIGMTRFAASEKAEELFPHFGITVDAVIKAAKGVLGQSA